MKRKILDKLNKISFGNSEWKESARFRETNEAWLDKSAEIALMVLRALRSKNMTQKDLAEKLNISAQQISKIVQGKENLTLETISKLENALQIKLVEMPAYTYQPQIVPTKWLKYPLMEETITSNLNEMENLYLVLEIETFNYSEDKSSLKNCDPIKSESTYKVEPDLPEYKSVG